MDGLRHGLGGDLRGVDQLSHASGTNGRREDPVQVLDTGLRGGKYLRLLTDVDCTTGILFGRERSGLTNDEVALADGIIAIPSVMNCIMREVLTLPSSNTSLHSIWHKR